MKTIKLLSFILGILFVSCSISDIEDFVVGDKFVSNSSGIMLIDTSTINTSTIKFDSIYSNSVSRFLVGCNFNPYTGYKSSSAFMQMIFTDDIANKSFVFDSLCLVLSYDAYYSGDTTVQQTISVHRLTEDMALDDNGNLYTTSKFKYDDVPLGTVRIAPRPKTNKNLYIRLSDDLGNRLSEMIQAKKDTITDESLFISYFKGLVIKSEQNLNGAAIGFRKTISSSSESTNNSSLSTPTAPEIRLYYHLKPNPNNLSDLYYKFIFSSGRIYFNQISEESSGTPFENISLSDNELKSAATDNKLIVQSGIQLFTKFKFPHIDDLLLIGKNSGFISAQLILHPIKGTYLKSSDLPDSLYIYSSDRKNKLSSQVTIPGSTTIGVYATLNIVKEVEETVTYQADITNFIKTELSQTLETTKSLMIGFSSTRSAISLDHIILGGAGSGKYSPELKIYYYHN